MKKTEEWTDEKREEFAKVCKPLMKWLCDTGLPYDSIRITSVTAELLCGEIAIHTTEFATNNKKKEKKNEKQCV